MPAPPLLSAEVLLKDRRVESFRLEFKSQWDERTKSAILHTICAFANDLDNQNGGYIVIGVEDQGGAAVLPPRGLDVDVIERTQKEIGGAVRQWISPEYQPSIRPEQVDGRHLLVIHCPTGQNRPYDAAERPEKGAQRAPWVRVGPETKKATGELRRRLDEVSQRIPFDAQPCYELRARDLNPDLVEDFLHRAGSGLADDGHTTEERLRGLGLLQRVNGHEAPRNAALLFFTGEPQERFRGAQIDVVQIDDGGDKLEERVIAGRLPFIIEEGLRALKAIVPTLVRKQDDRADADRHAAWPFPAIEEALVNAVHHRGYDPGNPDPVKVLLHPDRMVITSYPGPMPGLSRDQLDRGEIAHVRSRNRHVGELLKAISLAEARGSGISKIRRAMERAGNPPPRFVFDEPERTYFEVTLPIHPAHLPRALALPLRVGVPAPPDELFGRDMLIERVNRELEHQHIALISQPGRGSSSLLNGLESATTNDERHRLDLRGVAPGRFVRFVDDLLEERRTSAPLVLLLDHVAADLLDVVSSFGRAHPEARLVIVPDDLVGEDDPLWDIFHPLVVPPLSAASARSLATRLLAGQGIRDADALAPAIEAASAGIPTLIHRLIQRLAADSSLRQPARVDEAMLELFARRGDPTGLRRRRDALSHIARGLTGDRVEWSALAFVAHAPAGVSVDDLTLALLDRVTSAEARTTVQRLLEAGWLVERDGRISLEHPLLREAWLNDAG